MSSAIRFNPDPSTYYLGGLGQIIISVCLDHFICTLAMILPSLALSEDDEPLHSMCLEDSRLNK